MPRNSAGVYALPPTNPVIPFTTIATSWANPTMSDIAAELTNSLDRTGRGGMLAPFRIYDGNISQPGLGFTNEVGLGLWRSGTGVMQFVAAGTNLARIDSGLGGFVTPAKMLHYGDVQWRQVGAKWFQQAVYNNTLYFSWSQTADAEDWAPKMHLTSSGDLGVYGLLDATAGLRVTGQVNTTGVVIHDGSTGSIAAANYPWVGYKLEVKSDVTNQNANAAMIGFHRTGLYGAVFGIDTDNNWKVGGWSLGANAYTLLHENNSFAYDGGIGAHLNAQWRNIRTTGSITAGSVSGTRGGDSAVFNGAADLRVMQTLSCASGSNISAIYMNQGQIGRLEVIGNGAATLPGNIHWAIGAPVWGVFVTLVTIFFDGATYFGTTTPFNS